MFIGCLLGVGGDANCNELCVCVCVPIGNNQFAVCRSSLLLVQVEALEAMQIMCSSKQSDSQ